LQCLQGSSNLILARVNLPINHIAIRQEFQVCPNQAIFEIVVNNILGLKMRGGAWHLQGQQADHLLLNRQAQKHFSLPESDLEHHTAQFCDCMS
jgi:hypothetical protein